MLSTIDHVNTLDDDDDAVKQLNNKSLTDSVHAGPEHR